MTERSFPLGKLDMGFLSGLLERYARCDERVIVGAQVGEDAAVIEYEDRYLVAKTDPITFATDEIGWYAVHVNANDLATAGATPKWFLVTLLLPEGQTTEGMVEDVFKQIHDACADIGAILIGGHTEVTSNLDRPIVVGLLLGEVAKPDLVRTSGGRAGDHLVLAKGVSIEGTAIIARELESDLLAKGFEPEWVAQAQGYLYEPGISVLREAQLATRTVRVHAMHDPTEGGVATGMHEMADAAGVGVHVDGDAIPLLPHCARLCAEYKLDPMGLIASGALLLAVAPEDSAALLAAYAAEGTSAAVVGELVPSSQGRILRRGGQELELKRFDQDEITKLF